MRLTEAQFEESDTELMQQLMDGNIDAMTSLIQRYEEEMRWFIEKRSERAHFAEDVLQEVWLKVQERADRFNTEQEFRPWLYGIARNVLRKYWRIERSQIRLRKRECDQVRYATTDSVEAAISSQDTCAKIHEALMSITNPGHRDVLTSLALEELSVEEIAERSNQTTGAVRVCLHRARRKFREILARPDFSTIQEILTDNPR